MFGQQTVTVTLKTCFIELWGRESAVKGRGDRAASVATEVEGFGSKRNRKVWKLARKELRPA